MSALAYPLLLVFPALMALSAVYDLLTMTIPNRLTLVILALFPVAAFAAGFDLALVGWHLLAFAGVLAFGLFMFAMGWIGGGDAKMAAATALWLGPFMPLLEWGILFAILGGALTLLILMGRGIPLPLFLARQEWAARLHDRRTGVPYGIALGVAAMMVFPKTEIFLRLAS